MIANDQGDRYNQGMLSAQNLEQLSQELYVYDVVQGAWEQEPNGFEANAAHVLTHLAKDLSLKDFNNPDESRTAIAPDSLQYAFRLARWGGVEPAELTEKRGAAWFQASKAAAKIGIPTEHAGAHILAMSVIAINLHDLGHASARAEAIEARRIDMRFAGRLLVESADLQAKAYEFDLVDAFRTRLTSLRRRFGIAQPEA